VPHPCQATSGFEPNANAANERSSDAFTRATVGWASLRSSRALAWLKRLRPLVLLVRACLHYGGLLLRPYLVSWYFRHNAVRKLQIGSDIWLLPGWLNTDLYPRAFGCVTLNATKHFPFRSGSFDYIFSEHQLEHIGYNDAVNMLRESHRVLRPGGKLRIALPRLDSLVALFTPSQTDLQQKYIAVRTGECYPAAAHPNPCFAMNAAFMNWGHRFLYDEQTLKGLLQEIGYTCIHVFAPGQSDDPNFAGIEMRTSETDLYETMVIQAVRGGIQ